MVTVVLVMAVALVAGAAAGARLARRGVTAENALVGRQLLAWTVLGTVAAVGLLLYYAPRISWMPSVVALYAEASVWHGARALASFATGLLVALEWPGRRQGRRLRTMIAGAAILAVGAGYLVHRSLSIEGLLAESRIGGGIVFQTTAYTCAPASIATLLQARGETWATEAALVELAGTTREGTSTLREIEAMRAVGLEPRYARGLTAESLAAAGVGAVLHVDEPVGTATVRHAVALLEMDTVRRTITVGNPLHGRQVHRYDQLRGWWLGEAVFAGGLPIRVGPSGR